MAFNSLKDVYLDQLQDLHSACQQSLEITTKMGEAAKDSETAKALKDGAQGISDGIGKLESICADHGISPSGEHCKAMAGLVAEAKAHVFEEEFGDDDARDALIITQYQRMVHYAIAGYGSLLAFANRLGLKDDAARLQKMLDDTYSGDRHMTHIATHGVNARAA